MSLPAVAASTEQAEKQAIIDVIARMEAAWNRGDFRGYMEGFASPDVVFVSKGRFQQGWQGTLDHYIRDYGASPEARGSLHFYDIRIEMLSGDAAQLISRYQLVRQQHPQYGINTRLMRKVHGRWVLARRRRPLRSSTDAALPRPHPGDHSPRRAALDSTPSPP